MRYEVKRNGKVICYTEHEECRYDQETERELQEAGHDIFVDGKKLRKISKTARKESTV